MTLASAGTVTRPEPNGQMPAMARNNVDLPAPEGPVTSTRSPAANSDVLGGDEGLAVGQADVQTVDAIACASARGLTSIDRRRDRDAARPAAIASSNPASRCDDRAPFGDLTVGGDEIRQRALHAVEGRRGLHQAAELHGAGRNRPGSTTM